MHKTENPLGKQTRYFAKYSPEVLHAIERSESRRPAGIEGNLPFQGEDVWTCYELTWLNKQGLPRVAALSIRVPCRSPYLVESKSLKLYLNAFSQEYIESEDALCRTITKDLNALLKTSIYLELMALDEIPVAHAHFEGICLDKLEAEIIEYSRTPELLEVKAGPKQAIVQEPIQKNETVYTHLFRSLCPVTGQPDFASVMVHYSGQEISHQALLAYLVSYRNHTAFHESTVEQIFLDLMQYCKPEMLTVFARFTRRGGVDINPFRSNIEAKAPAGRLSRQ
ncbi:MAG: NADPH-dependent 7-cyano-7-deazaguanine reductase QueF [Pseudomonadales bacterium]|nr:NADPH-dependent 7-cyano-7-deazaguanine reductase QueF [Pseudomonadales bacterium]